MAVTADGRVALSATGQLHRPARFNARSGRLVEFINGEFMGQKLKFQQRKNNNAIRSHVRSSLTADLAGETKVRFLVLFDPRPLFFLFNEKIPWIWCKL